ncbi:MAG: ESPR domain-containing protein [Megasphaera elsdenii]|nr:ESPR domain-containing protein [Megasphaera elsdenii]
MNKTYKVIYNRTRCMYQVVSELAKGRTKSETPEMLKTVFSKHGSLARGIVMTVLSMSLAMPVGVAVQAADAGTSATSGDTTGVTTTNKPVTVKDGAVLVGSGAVSVSSSTDTTTITIDVPTNEKVEANGTGLVTSGTVYTAVNVERTAREAAVQSVTDKIGTLGANVKTNTDAIDTNKNTIAANTSDITSLKKLSNVTDAGKTVIKEQAKQAVKVAQGDRVTVISSGSETGDGTITYTVTANNNGSIASGNTNLVSGGTMYTELRPDSTGTYYYISNANTTAANLIALDTNLKNVIDAIGLDADDTTTSYTSKLNKYFKVNPEVTTAADGKTKNYAADAAANGTNSVAIGPSAQAGEKTTDTTREPLQPQLPAAPAARPSATAPKRMVINP